MECPICGSKQFVYTEENICNAEYNEQTEIFEVDLMNCEPNGGKIICAECDTEIDAEIEYV